MRFQVENLPKGLKLDADTGRITGKVNSRGRYGVVLRAANDKGTAEKKFRIVVGDKISLTPAMGWNSWNLWAAAVDQDKVMRSAKAMAASGLINHGWTYINIDDTWQGKRGGRFNAIQPNEKFPDMEALCSEIHEMGLKAGIYSTPWITSYAMFIGGSSDDPSGEWSKEFANVKHYRHGKYSFVENDVKQWAEWGFDYLKYDWNPNDVPHVKEMSTALRKTMRDIIFSLSNTAPFDHAADWVQLANSWRTTGDITDGWGGNPKHGWSYGILEIGFSQERWAPVRRAGTLE